MATIKVQDLNATIPAQPGQSILNSLIHEGQPITTTCGGKARCGCCRIRILEGNIGVSQVNEQEIRKLGDEVISQKWRLACQTHILRDITIYIPGADELDQHCL